MKKYFFVPVMLTVAAVISACSTIPTSTGLLEQTRSDYIAAQSNPNVATYAALEMKQAGEALGRANEAANKNDSPEQIDKLAYLAKQKIALTQEVAKQKTTEAQIAATASERDQLRLAQRTNEANRARMSADQSKLEAQTAQGSAADAERRAQLAKDEALEAQRKAQMAQSDSAESQRRTQEAQARAAELEAELSALSAKQTERGIVITLGDVLFGVNQANLNKNGMRTAEKLSDFLKNHPERTVLIEGFTDSTGSDAHNQVLSERRAAAVQGALKQMGVERQRIDTRGYGEAHPIASNDTAQERQLNRRVEIILSDPNGKVAPR